MPLLCARYVGRKMLDQVALWLGVELHEAIRYNAVIYAQQDILMPE